MGKFNKKAYLGLIFLFLKTTENLNYPKEFTAAKKLLSLSSDINFWQSDFFKEKKKSLLSLFQLLTVFEQKNIKNNYSLYEKQKRLSFEKETVKLEEDKTGKSLNLKSKKNISLLDFIKNDSQKTG